ILCRDQADATIDRDVAHLGPLSATDDGQGALETRRVSHREQLLGIGAAALATRFTRWSELDIELSVAGLAVAVSSPTCNSRFGGVHDLVHVSSRGDVVEGAMIQQGVC